MYRMVLLKMLVFMETTKNSKIINKITCFQYSTKKGLWVSTRHRHLQTSTGHTGLQTSTGYTGLLELTLHISLLEITGV